MFQNGTLTGLAVAAGMWAAAISGAAAAESSPTMQLGMSALPPQAYVAFCERQPWDCGAVPQEVLARAEQADMERAALFAAASAITLASTPGAQPAALLASALASAQVNAVSSAAVSATPAPADAMVASAATITRAAAQVAPAPAPIPAAAAVPAPAAPAAPLQMDRRLWSKLNRVNNTVNRDIRQATDLAIYGKADYWTTPLEDGGAYGDCEDYVLEKQRALLAAGLPREALNIAVATTPWGENHAVLLVDTSEGAFVLDNLSPWIVPWNKTGYRWRERQVNGDAFTWMTIQDPSRPQAPRLIPSDRLIVAAVR